jgi:hypothetical protein
MKTKRLLGWSLGSLAGVLIERGELDEGLTAGREGLPLLLEDGDAWIFFDLFTLRLALAGRACDAARLAGYSDYTWTSQEARRHPIEERTRERLRSMLQQKLATDDLERLSRRGREADRGRSVRTRARKLNVSHGHASPAGCVRREMFMLPLPYPATELKSTRP